MVFHVLNRGVGKNQLFFNDEDDLAFGRIIEEQLGKAVDANSERLPDAKSLAFCFVA